MTSKAWSVSFKESEELLVGTPAVAGEKSSALRLYKTIMRSLAKGTSLPSVVQMTIEYGEAVNSTLRYGAKFSSVEPSNSWNKLQHDLKEWLPEQQNCQQRRSRESAFALSASKHAFRIFQAIELPDSAICWPTFFRPRALARAGGDPIVDYISQVVVITHGIPVLAASVILHVRGDKRDQRMRSSQPIERGKVHELKVFELAWANPSTLRLVPTARGLQVAATTAFAELKVVREERARTDISLFILDSGCCGCEALLANASHAYEENLVDAAAPKAAAKGKAKPKAKPAPPLRPASGHDQPEEVVGRCSTMPREKITLFKPGVFHGEPGTHFYAGKYDFGAGGLTADGRMLIQQSFRAMLLLYTR